MFVTFEAKPAKKPVSKSKKVLVTLGKGAGKVWKFCKSSVSEYFKDMMKREFVIVKNGIIYKKGCGPRPW